MGQNNQIGGYNKLSVFLHRLGVDTLSRIFGCITVR